MHVHNRWQQAVLHIYEKEEEKEEEEEEEVH